MDEKKLAKRIRIKVKELNELFILVHKAKLEIDGALAEFHNGKSGSTPTKIRLTIKRPVLIVG